mgnify:CR=1 FL=1
MKQNDVCVLARWNQHSWIDLGLVLLVRLLIKATDQLLNKYIVLAPNVLFLICLVLYTWESWSCW